jgi:hypothetical protein
MPGTAGSRPISIEKYDTVGFAPPAADLASGACRTNIGSGIINGGGSPLQRVVEDINPILRGWVRYFAIGNSTDCFNYVRHWVEQKVRRHVMRARGRPGFGWKKWSMTWVYCELGLYNDYRIRYYTPRRKATSAG